MTLEPQYIITKKDRDEALWIPRLNHVEDRIKVSMLTGIIERSRQQTPAPDCFNDINDDGICEHATEPEHVGMKPICTINGTCHYQEIFDRRPVYYQTHCGHPLAQNHNQSAYALKENPFQDIKLTCPNCTATVGFPKEVIELYCWSCDTRIYRPNATITKTEDRLQTLKDLVLLKHTRHGCINVGELVDCIDAMRTENESHIREG